MKDNYSYLTNNLLSALKAVRDKQHTNSRSMERIKIKTLIIENHDSVSIFGLKKSTILQLLNTF